MERLIKCININKSFKDKVITDFNYEFKEKGLYVLYGPSGCGKTTLLNLLCGALSLDSGTIELFDKEYKKIVDNNISKSTISYITQNNYFIDYLTINENIKLCQDKADKQGAIDYWLKAFNMYSKRKLYPKNLSGGELQIISLICAIIQKKPIILLDEPTSSLDKEKAKKVIEVLNKIKNKALIICASHDNNLINIADEKIDMTNYENLRFTNMKQKKYKEIKNNKKSIIPFMIKKYFFKENIFSQIVLLIVFLIIIMLLNLCSNYEEKLNSSLLNYHNINFVNYKCYTKKYYSNENHCDSIIDSYGGIKNQYRFELNNPLEIDINYTKDFLVSFQTLPYDKNLLKDYEKHIKYGSYFEDSNDIILGIDYANKISNNPESLIGKEHFIQMTDKMEKFRIVGIFDDIENSTYFKALVGVNYTNKFIFISDNYTQKYEYDGIKKFDEEEQGFVNMRAYFDSPDNLKKFYNENQWTENEEGLARPSKNGIVVETFEDVFIDFKWLILAFDYYLKPAIIITFIIAMLFYFEIEYVQSKYKSYILSTYNYLGYGWKKIISNCIFVSVLNTILLYLVSFGIGSILNNLLNYILIKYEFTNFKLFITNKSYILILFYILISISILLSFVVAFLQKKKNWLKSVKEGDDFI